MTTSVDIGLRRLFTIAGIVAGVLIAIIASVAFLEFGVSGSAIGWAAMSTAIVTYLFTAHRVLQQQGRPRLRIDAAEESRVTDNESDEADSVASPNESARPPTALIANRNLNVSIDPIVLTGLFLLGVLGLILLAILTSGVQIGGPVDVVLNGLGIDALSEQMRLVMFVALLLAMVATFLLIVVYAIFVNPKDVMASRIEPSEQQIGDEPTASDPASPDQPVVGELTR